MKHRGARIQPQQEISAASLADIAFLLLIFFLSTTFFALEEGIPLILPGSQTPDVKVKRKDIVIVEARANGMIVVEKETVALESLKGLIERRLAENQNLVVVVESHPQSEYGLMVGILDELRLANARRISLKTTKT
jgi:biopolymer transport protein ExbD